MTAQALGALDWLPLKLDAHMANTVDDIDRNIRSALDRNLTPLQALIGQERGAVAVVGSGPSLKDNWRELRTFNGEIIACNAAFQFLLARGITAKYMFCFDADPLMLEFMTRKENVTYLLASRCPPGAFDAVAGLPVVCWHAAGDTNIEQILIERRRMEPMVIGGSAAVTRAMLIAQILGYREHHLYGADSSFKDGDTHIRQSTTVERHIKLKVGDRQFDVAPWMAQQAEDFKVLAPQLSGIHGVTLHVHGDGLIPHLAQAMGFKTDQGVMRQLYREWKWKLRTLWAYL